MSSSRKYKCPYCGRSRTREQLPGHLERNHMDMLPEGFTPLRATFHIVNNKPFTYTRPCRICGGPTDWDEYKGRYNFLCSKKSCHDAWVKNMKDTMGDKMGSNRPTASKEGLQKMLAARKISGKYKFQDGGEKSFVGSYEKEALKFMDQVMYVKSEDLVCPGPMLEYEMDGKKHYYIPDMLYLPYNLIIEVKDGGDNPNGNKAMADVRRRSIAKEKFIIDNTDYNYLRLTNNDFSQLLYVFADLKMHMIDNDSGRVIHVNENSFTDDESGLCLNEISRLILEISQKDINRNKVLSPVFIINTYTGSAFGDLQRNFLNAKYTHALISVDPELKTMYSFGSDKNGRLGLVEDNIDRYKAIENGIMRVLCLMVSPKAKATINKSLEFYKNNKEKTHYGQFNLLDYMKGSNKISSYGEFSLFCSEFVDAVLKNANLDASGHSSRNTSPDDLGGKDSRVKGFKLFEGKTSKFNGSKIKDLIKRLKATTSYDKLKANRVGNMTSSDDINLGKENRWIVFGTNALKNIQKIFKHENFNIYDNLYPSVTTLEEEVGGIPAGCGTMDGIIVVNYLQNMVFAKPEIGIADNYRLDNIITTAGDKVLHKESREILKNSIYSTYFVECNSKRIYQIISENLDKPVPNQFLYNTIFNHKSYTNDQIMFEAGCHKMKDYYQQLDELREGIIGYIRYNILPESEEDKNILNRWNVKSDDGADNCCIKVRGYEGIMRGRSSMIILRHNGLDWETFLDHKNGEWSAPGGGWNIDESPVDAAMREAREEAYMNVTDVMYGGTLIEYHEKVQDWVKQHVKDESQWWKGYYSRIFVGMYHSKYMGKVSDIDKDPMAEEGEWYKVSDIIDKVCVEYANAILMYISKQDKQFSTTALGESLHNILYERQIMSESKDKSTIDDNFKTKKKVPFFVADFNLENATKYIKEFSKESLEYSIETKKGEIIVDKETDSCIGYIMVAYKGRYTGTISPIYVYEKYRGQGFSELLLEDAIKKFGGYKLNVYKDNEVAIKLYKKYGFKVVKEHSDHYEMELDSKKPIQESTNIRLYHGSHADIDDYILPKNKSFEDNNYVFATTDKNFALCYSGNIWHDGIINQGYYNDQLYLVELVEGSFDKVFNTYGYIYELEYSSQFKNRHRTEYLSKSKARIIDKTYIPNVLDAIEKSGIELYRYPNKPKWWDKFIKSKFSYSDSFKDVKDIVDSLSAEELHNICTGTFKDSPFVVYRKVVCVDKEPAAFIDAYSIPKEMEKDEAVIVCATKPKFRGRGLIKLCYDGLEDTLRSKGIKTIYWETTKDNKASASLARSLGFTSGKNINKDDDNYQKSINESALLERKLSGFNMLYHGSAIGGLKIVDNNSFNNGNKFEPARQSSFWFANMDYAAMFATAEVIYKKSKELGNKIPILIDNDMKCLVKENQAQLALDILKKSVGYVYQKGIDGKYITGGNSRNFPEYTIDFPVTPDFIHKLTGKQMAKYVKVVTEDYYNNIIELYKKDKMFFGADVLTRIHDTFMYSTNKEIIDAKKDIKNLLTKTEPTQENSFLEASNISKKDFEAIRDITNSLSKDQQEDMNITGIYKGPENLSRWFIIYDTDIKSLPVAYFTITNDGKGSADISLATRAGYQGKGYGDKVAKLGSKWVDDNLSKYTGSVYWATKPHNKASQHLAEKYGFKVVRDDDKWKTYAKKGTKKYAPLSESVDMQENINKINLNNYNMIMVGEIHNRKMIEYYDKLLTKFKPEYFICEFADMDKCLTDEELKDRMDHATNGSSSMDSKADYQYNYWCYELALKHHVKLIGCNPLSKYPHDTLEEEYKFREPYMLNVLKQYEDKRCVVQLGDHHLRSIPNSKEFIEFCGEENKDERGIVSDCTVSFASPVFEYFKDKSNVLILRVRDNYIREQNFIKATAIPKDITKLYEYLSSFDYGVMKDGKRITDLEHFDFYNNYKSLTLREFELYKIGICWDFTHYEADWFKKHGYKHESYYIEANDASLSTHTFTVFYLKNSPMVFYFEVSWGDYMGIEIFKDIDTLLETVMSRHAKFTTSKNIICHKFTAENSEFEGLSCREYMIKASGSKTRLK